MVNCSEKYLLGGICKGGLLTRGLEKGSTGLV